MPREEYTTILSYNDSQRIITRNTDHMMKVWDLRMFEKPMAHYSHMLNYFPGSKVCMSPDQRYLVVGTSIGEHSD